MSSKPHRTRAMAMVVTLAALCVLVPRSALAHFILSYPPSWTTQDTFGDPEKVAPCGVDSTVSYTPTNMVTAFAPGQKITLQWQEVIPHDGWYRIAISYKNRTDLKDPTYAVDALGNSTDAGIENPPVPPVLVDGLFPHTAASITSAPKAYTYDLTLPTTPCTKCTLQVIQIMLNHPYNNPGGYTYHHCADISIQAGADGGTTVVDAGTGGRPADAGGSGTSSGAGSSSGAGTSSGGTSSGGGSTGSSGAGSSSSGGEDGGGDDGGTPAVDATTSGCHCALAGGRGSAASGLAALGLAALVGVSRRRRRASRR